MYTQAQAGVKQHNASHLLSNHEKTFFHPYVYPFIHLLKQKLNGIKYPCLANLEKSNPRCSFIIIDKFHITLNFCYMMDLSNEHPFCPYSLKERSSNQDTKHFLLTELFRKKQLSGLTEITPLHAEVYCSSGDRRK